MAINYIAIRAEKRTFFFRFYEIFFGIHKNLNAIPRGLQIQIKWDAALLSIFCLNANSTACIFPDISWLQIANYFYMQSHVLSFLNIFCLLYSDFLQKIILSSCYSASHFPYIIAKISVMQNMISLLIVWSFP